MNTGTDQIQDPQTAPNCPATALSTLDTALFSALADASRIGVLRQLILQGNNRTVNQIARCCPQNLSVVSRHLKILREAGILAAERQGKEVVYRLRKGELVALLRNLADDIDHCC